MSAPANKNIKDMNGRWSMSKAQSDATDPVLALQGIGWMTRKAIGLASVTLDAKMGVRVPEDNPSAGEVLHIDIDQFATGGLKGTSEHRVLDWKYRPHSDWLFGDMQGRSRLTTIEAILKEAQEKSGSAEEDAKYLCDGWLDETKNGEVLESFVENEGKGWTVWQVWGFAQINGERWHVRRLVARKMKKDEAVRARLCYEWIREPDA